VGLFKIQKRNTLKSASEQLEKYVARNKKENDLSAKSKKRRRVRHERTTGIETHENKTEEEKNEFATRYTCRDQSTSRISHGKEAPYPS